MNNDQKFFICELCGNLTSLIIDKGTPMSCCGKKMTALTPNTVEASNEKHLPDVTVSGDKVSVQVGSVPHAMTEEHHICFVYLKTERGGQRKALKIGEEPKAEFCLVADKPVAAYEYCNLHGLWRTDI